MLRFERWQVKWWNKPSPPKLLASNTPGYAWLACGSPRSTRAIAFATLWLDYRVGKLMAFTVYTSIILRPTLANLYNPRQPNATLKLRGDFSPIYRRKYTYFIEDTDKTGPNYVMPQIADRPQATFCATGYRWRSWVKTLIRDGSGAIVNSCPNCSWVGTTYSIRRQGAFIQKPRTGSHQGCCGSNDGK